MGLFTLKLWQKRRLIHISPVSTPTKSTSAKVQEAIFKLVAKKLLTTTCFSVALAISLTGCQGSDSSRPKPFVFSSKVELGESLFFDTNLSLNRTQSCSSCHNPDHAFIDNRSDENGKVLPVSLGDDELSFGDRTAPTLSYASFTPDFGLSTHPRFSSQQPDYVGYVGGQFWDGRANGLTEQAMGPPLNPIEMGMPDEASVVDRLLEDPSYEASFKTLYGDDIFSDTQAAFEAMAQAIALFEQTEPFAPFDSKYDRSLRGEYTYDPLSKAALGKARFFSQQFTNCATCHQLQPVGSTNETFTNYEYHNTGTPINTEARRLNGLDPSLVDDGLLNNPLVEEASEKGKYKVPTLRNIAVTGPYMHNGVFKELKTVMQFYDHFLSGSSFTNNPETGLPWAPPEHEETIAYTELRDGNALSDEDIEGLVCFLRTLTDAQYEHLIEDNGIDCGE